MRRIKYGLFQGAIIVGLGGVLAAPAFAEIPDFKEVDPIAHTTYGHGYDTTRRIAFSKGGGCVTVDRSKTYSQGQTSSKSGFERVTSTSEVAEEMGLSVSASISAVSPAGKFSASAKADVASGTNSSQFNETILAYSFTRLKPTYLDPSYISLKQKYIDMLKDPKQGIGAFKAECGDTFIYGIQEGREFYGTAFITKQTLEQWTKFSVGATASYEGATVDADAAADYAKAMNQSFGSASIKINVSRSDTGLSNPSSVEQMVSQFQKYNVNSSGGTNAVKYILSSYANADGYPIEDPLSPPSNDEKLGYMVSALWDLKALQQDASFVEGSSEMFAMGTTTKKRNARKAAITKARKAWRSEFDSLRTQAVKCVDDFTGSCESLAAKYRDRDPLTERSIMPTRYTSDCSQKMQLVDIGGRKILGYSMPQSSVRGDTEMGSGPVKVRTWLKLYKDGSQLKALHKTNTYEWKTKKDGSRNNKYVTEFNAQKTAVVFDLDQPNAYASVHGSLSECAYKSNPVSASRIRGRVLALDSKGRPIPNRKKFPPFKTKMGDTEWHGQTDGISGKKPRGSIKLTGGAKGLLTYSYCELDRKGKDGGMPCRAPGTKNTYVELVNKLDLEADKWSTSTGRTRIASAKNSVSTAKKSKRTGKPNKRMTRKAAGKASGKTLLAAKMATLTSAISKAAKKKQNAAKKRAAKAKALQTLPTRIQKLLAARNAKTKKQKN